MDEAVAPLALVPALRIASHRAAETLFYLCESYLLCMLNLILREPLPGIGCMAAERAEDLFDAHLIAPVVFVNFELRQARIGRALAVEIVFRVRRHGYGDLVCAFEAAQLTDQFIEHHQSPSTVQPL